MTLKKLKTELLGLGKDHGYCKSEMALALIAIIEELRKALGNEQSDYSEAEGFTPRYREADAIISTGLEDLT